MNFLNKWFLIFLITFPLSSLANFPTKPISLLVYTKPGGAIDIFARKFKKIASKYTNANFVIVNKAGAGGLISLKHLLKKKPDGYTLAAITKSNIGKLVSSGSNISPNAFYWAAMLVSDPEAIIVRKDGPIKTFKDLKNHAKKNPKKQIWVGPASGGNDHIMALKTWNKLQISPKWIPYKGGSKAMTALMGGHGHVYVGNPGDTIGRPSLKVIAISSQKRLVAPFNHIPTFSELGVTDHDEEIMWRGFILKNKPPKYIQNYYSDLFKKVANDKEWQNYILSLGAKNILKTGESFKKIVLSDFKEFESILKKIGIGHYKTQNKNKVLSYTILILFFILINCVFYFRKSQKEKILKLVFASVFTLIGCIFILESSLLPKLKTGPSWIPNILAGLLVILSIFLYIGIIFSNKTNIYIPVQKQRVFFLIIWAICFFIFWPILGHYVTTFISSIILFQMMKVRDLRLTIILSLTWTVITYFVFYKTLFVPLPIGTLFERLI